MVWHLLRKRQKGLAVAVCNQEIPLGHLAWYIAYYDVNTEKKEERNRGTEELMTALTKQQTNTTPRLQFKYEGNSNTKPVNSCASIDCGQITKNVRIEHALQLEIRKSNNAAIEMVFADFSL